MADIGKWSGGSVSTLPGTTWAVPTANIFPTQDRNDSSIYGLSSHVLTLPSSSLANGYLVVAAFEFEDTSNGRFNPQARFVYSGSGNAVSAYSSGYNRDTSEDRAYCRTWAFVDSPSASDTFTFQWRRDTDVPTGGTVRSSLQVIPLFYADVGIYSSASTACPGGTTPNQITGFSGTDGTNITLASNTITVSGDNKKYLCFGGYYWQGIGNARTQRWGGFRIDGTKDDSSKGYSYGRNGLNADIGEIFTTILQTSTANRTLDMFVYLGDGVGARQGGADVPGNTTGSNPNHAMVVLELNDSAEVFSSTQSVESSDLSASPTAINVNDTTNFNDTASFTSVATSSINCVQAGDVLLGADVAGASVNVGTGARWTAYAEFTNNGVVQSESFAGDYLRNNQGSQDTFGWSANLLSSLQVSAGDDVGVTVTELSGTENGGNPVSPAGWTGFWGVNLDTLEDSGGTSVNVSLGSQSYTKNLNSISVSTTASVTASLGLISFGLGLNPISATASQSVTTTLSNQNYSLAQYSLTTSLGATANLGVINYIEALRAISASTGGSINASLGVQDLTLTQNTLNVTASQNTIVSLSSFSYSIQEYSVSVSTGATAILNTPNYLLGLNPITTSISGGITAGLSNQSFSLGLNPTEAGTGVGVSINRLQYTQDLNTLTTSLGQGIIASLNSQGYDLALNQLQALLGTSIQLGQFNYLITQNNLGVTTVQIIPETISIISRITKQLELIGKLTTEKSIISEITKEVELVGRITKEVSIVSRLTKEIEFYE